MYVRNQEIMMRNNRSKNGGVVWRILRNDQLKSIHSLSVMEHWTTTLNEIVFFAYDKVFYVQNACKLIINIL